MKHFYFLNKNFWAVIFLFSLSFTLLNIGFIHAQDNRITLRSGQKIFASGMNMAWGNFARDLTSYNEEIFIQAMDEISAAGGNTMRWWLHVNGIASPLFENDTVSGLSTEIENLRKILDLAYERHMAICISLWSHDMLSDGGQNLDAIKYMLEDSVGTMAYVNNALIPLVSGVKGHPAILCWEIFNEPEGMLSTSFPEVPWSGWTDRRTNYDAIQRFTNLCAGAIHRTDPGALVTTGAHRIAYVANIGSVPNNYADSVLIDAGGDSLGTLDFYEIHYYAGFGEGLSPFAYQISHWVLDKPLVIGEFSAHGPNVPTDGTPNSVPPTTEDAYQYLYDNGYAGGWSWTWTGHDGNGDVTNAEEGMLPLLQNYPEDIYIKYAPGYIWSFSAAEYTLSAGDSVRIKWATTDSSVVTINGETVASTDSIYVHPDTTTIYTLVASGPHMSASKEFTIEVFQTGHIFSFNANPVAIALGDSSLLSWSVVTGSVVTLDGDTVAADSSMYVFPDTTTTYTLKTTGTINDSSYLTIVVSDELIVNRALNHPAYVSSNESAAYNPGLAVDGNTSSRWSSAYSDPQWIYVDMLGFYDVQRVVLNWEAAFGANYEIQISNDAVEWTTIYSVTGEDGGIDDITDLSGVGRYVRMYGTSRGPNNWGYSLYEFEIYGVPVEGVVVNSYADDFEDGILTGWVSFDDSTFYLTENEGVLTIDYNRTANSDMWSSLFGLVPLANIEIVSNPVIKIKIKSNIATQVTLKPYFGDESNEVSDWLQQSIPGNDSWATYTFNLTNNYQSGPIPIIYMYLDGGTTAPKSGIVQFDDFEVAIAPVVGLEDDKLQPLTYSLRNAYPNPFNPSTTIEYTLKKAEKVKIEVYDVLGKKVKTLYNGEAAPGLNSLQWHGVNEFGITVSSGIYFYRLQTESGYVNTKKMILMK